MSFAIRPRALRAIPAGIMIVLIALSCFARFGKNKVQYEKLNWSYRTSRQIRLHYHDTCAALPSIAFPWAHKAYAALQSDFGFTLSNHIPVILYATPSLFGQTNVITEVIPEGVGGFTELFKNRVVLPFNGSWQEFRHILHHELVHAFQFGILYQGLGGSLFRGSSVAMPLWFAEGLAEYLSSGWNSEADMFLMDRMVFGTVPPPGPELSGYMAYKGGQSFFHFLESSLGDSLFQAFLRAFRDTRKVEGSLEKTYGIPLEKLGEQWLRQLKRIYWPEIGRRLEPDERATNINRRHQEKSRFNLMPRLSPDGTRIAWFSDLKDYTRIMIADTSGKIRNEISQSGYAGFFESFHPFRSGITWSPQSDMIAFVTRLQGRDELRFVNLEEKSLVRRVAFAHLATIANPDWSAQGDRLVFSALDRDRSDLYLYTLSDSSLTRLTNSIEYEDYPRFSPDGTQIVFSHEDTSGLATRSRHTVPAPVRNLRIITLADTSVTELEQTEWNEKQAVFASCGEYLFFVSDRNGIDNLYYGHRDSISNARAITDFIGGVSAPDRASADSLLAFSLFQNGRWDVYLLRSALDSLHQTPLEPTIWQHTRIDTSAPFFRPFRNEPQTEPELVNDDTGIRETPPATPDTTPELHNRDMPPAAKTGPGEEDAQDSKADVLFGTLPGDTVQEPSLPHSLDTSSYPYRLSFSPDMISFGMGVSPSYGYAGTWLVALSDLLGDHRFIFAGDIQGRIREQSHLFGSYLNSRLRLNFGLGLFYNRSYTWLPVSHASSPGDDQSTVWRPYHDTNFGVNLSLRYPFGLTSRTEFTLYAAHVDRRTSPDSPVTRSFDIAVPTLGFVFDNILWGLTGPVNGMRARMDVTAIPPIPTLDAAYVSGDVDIRRYFHFSRRFVLALRAAGGASVDVTTGNDVTRRYFMGGSENWLLGEVNVDNATRDIHTIFYSDFVVPMRGWQYFDLTGSRYAVLNTEFRFPFIRAVSVAWPIPLSIRYINGVVFIDAGNAWDPVDQHPGIPLPQTLYGGTGFGMRANLGIFVLRYDRAWKTDWRNWIKSPINYFSLGADF